MGCRNGIGLDSAIVDRVQIAFESSWALSPRTDGWYPMSLASDFEGTLAFRFVDVRRGAGVNIVDEQRFGQ